MDVKQIRLISPEPVLAEILAKRKPILISDVGWKWIVSWIAEIGSIMRSRDYIAFNIAYMASYMVLDMAFAVMSKLGFTEKFSILKRLVGRH